MDCPKCGEELSLVHSGELSFESEDEVSCETSYYCNNCEKIFLFNEHFKRISSVFCCEVED